MYVYTRMYVCQHVHTHLCVCTIIRITDMEDSHQGTTKFGMKYYTGNFDLKRQHRLILKYWLAHIKQLHVSISKMILAVSAYL